MAVAYGMLGVLAAFAGVSFGTLNSSPLFNFAIALIFLIMSLAMAGVFNIDAASRIRIDPRKLPFSEQFAALFMGGVSALLAGACVAPVVISVLLFSAETVGQGNLYGALIPFALGIGMALPWPLAGAGLSILPKPGKFMAILKYAFAVLIFGAAVYYTFQGIKLLPDDELSMAEDGFAALEKAETESAETGKPVLIKFTASWCKNCAAMDRKVLRDKDVAEYVKRNFIMVTFPAENVNDPEISTILKKYGISGLPAFVILE
jgi:thiol:disulfide interchange protein